MAKFSANIDIEDFVCNVLEKAYNESKFTILDNENKEVEVITVECANRCVKETFNCIRDIVEGRLTIGINGS